MPSRPVAALESQGRVLLAALGVEVGGKIPVVTEDGRAFEYPSARILWRASALTVPEGSKREVGAALKALRAGLPRAEPWEALYGVVPAGVPLDPADLVAAGDDRAAAALALQAAEGGPWFRILNGRLVGSTAEEIAACAAAASAAERAAAAEAALAGLLAGKGGSAEAAAPALDRLLSWALGPEDAERPAIAVRLGFADVYEATERLDAAALLPPDAVPSLSRRGIPRTFPRKVREAAAPPDAAPREDLRALDTFAIDDPGTVEVDDALSVLRGPGGEPRLLVHIADAAAAVPAGGAVDLEARRRAVTVYLPDLRVPMLPPDLTAARISLGLGEERGALTAEVRVGADGAPEAVRIFRSLVRVGRRCGYAETAAALPEPLRPAEEMARAFRAARVAAGARVLEVPSLHLRVEGGVPVLEERAVTGLGDLAVGEAAVAFNRAAGAALRDAGAAAIWRVQDPPRGELPDRADPLFSLRARRLFAPVRFSLVPGPHAGIGAPFYLQATSPIRRYTDLLHQRQLAATLAGEAPPHDAAEVREMVDGLYRQERLVRAAEADREDYWLAAWLEARRGELFDAFVSRPVQRGRGHAWIPRMLVERPFRWPKEGPAAPPEGSPIRLRPGRLSRHRRLYALGMGPLPAVVLAAGGSVRMGRPKALVPYGGRPALARVVAACREGGCDPVLVVVGADADAVGALARECGAAVVENHAWERGRSTSVKAALPYLPAGAAGLVLFPVDHPLVEGTAVAALTASFAGDGGVDVVVPVHGGRRGHPVLVAASLFPALAGLGDDAPLRALWGRPGVRIREVAVEGEGILRNLDRPGEGGA